MDFQLDDDIESLRSQLGVLRAIVKDVVAAGLWLVAARAKWPVDGAATMLEWRARRKRLDGLMRAALRK